MVLSDIGDLADAHYSGPPPDRGQDERESNARNPGSNLFVTGIHPRLSESEVSRLFEKYGNVEGCSIMKDPHTQESRGFGFVKMVTAEEADAAKEGLQGENIEGRTLSIEKARRARPRTPTPGKYFGPPKRGKHFENIYFFGTDFDLQKTTFVVRLAVPASIDSMIVVVEVVIVDTVGDATKTATVAHPDTMIASVVHMDVVTTMDLVASTDMPQEAVTIATAAAVVTTTVAETSPTAAIVDALGVIAMLQESLGSLTVEVETKITALMIGTPVVDCGPLIYPGAERSAK